jgi:ssDNA-binding protein
MAKSVTSEVIAIPNARLSFPRLWKPKSFQEGQEPRFEATFILDPSNPQHAATLKKIKDVARTIATEAFAGKIPPDLKIGCLLDGNTKEYDGYKNMIAVPTHNQTRPAVVGRRRQPVVEGESEAPYAGCYVNGSITLWVQDNKWGKRINANLRGVQFVRDGDAFGIQPVDAEDEFEALEDDAGPGPSGASAPGLVADMFA